MRIDDFIITCAYFSLPMQIFFALYKFPKLAMMPTEILILAILFALFILLCGTGHLFRCIGETDGHIFAWLNGITAFISLLTALYLIPLIPYLCDSLQKSLQAEQESNRKLMTFMSFLCHEIRNPLFAITSAITFMGDDPSLSAEQRVGLESITQSSDLMLRLVNDVLDISKLESGKLQLENREFDLESVLQGTAESGKTEIERRGQGKVKFEFFMSTGVPRVIIGDSVRLLQIAYNLLSNAAKFTEEGFIRYSIDTVPVHMATANGWIQHNEKAIPGRSSKSTDSNETFALSLIEAAENGDSMINVDSTDDYSYEVIRLQVEDSGCGIPPERLDTIFEPYAQSKLSDYRKHGGTGLGLSILENLTRIMGGSIQVESKVEKGSTFSAYIPVYVPKGGKNKRFRASMSSKSVYEGVKNITLDQQAPSEDTSVRSNGSSDDSRGHLLSNSSKSRLVNPSTVLHTGQTISAEMLVIKPPVPPPPQSKATPSQNKKFDFPINDKRVLVVDDNMMNCKILGRMLSNFNLQHDVAHNGLEAVEFMKQTRNFVTNDPKAPQVGLVLMDWSMPVMDGCEAIRAIRALNITVPIVALTACALDEKEQDFLDSGANEFATKPIKRDDLYLKCRKYLSEPI